jgi:tripartite-type tricarboxylate transporter receptor subunit TctC
MGLKRSGAMPKTLPFGWRSFLPKKLGASITFFIGLLVTGLGPLPLASAQEYPTRPISLIVASTPGSAPDVLGRIIAHRLSEQLGQQVVVLTRPGAGTNIGVASVTRASPDGYTIGLASSPITINPHIMPSVGYRLEDLAPVSTIASAAEVLVVHPSTKANTVRELIALIKGHPGMPAGHPGTGTTPHLALEMFRRMAGLDVLEVPYKGGGEAQQGILSNQVAFMFSTSIGILPKVRGGTLRALAVSSATRIASAPELPTVAESGLPGFDVVGWYGLFVPTGTPKPVVDRLSAETRAALASTEVRKLLIDLGADPLGSTPEAFASLVKDEFERWGKLVKEAGITMK